MSDYRSSRVSAALDLPAVNITSLRTNPFDDDVSVAATVRQVREISQGFALHASVQAAVAHALEPLNAVERTSDIAVARALYYWVKRSVLFRSDDYVIPGDIEVIVAPDALLAMPRPQGDCDDQVTLLWAMLQYVGIQAWPVTIAADPQRPGSYSHIYLRALLDGGREIALDVSHGEYFGWEAPRQWYTRKQEWTI